MNNNLKREESANKFSCCNTFEFEVKNQKTKGMHTWEAEISFKPQDLCMKEIAFHVGYMIAIRVKKNVLKKEKKNAGKYISQFQRKCEWFWTLNSVLTFNFNIKLTIYSE